jgi:hypothetical protein
MLVATAILDYTPMKEGSGLFTDLTAEECATVSAGSTQVSFDLNTFLFILGASIVFGRASSDPVLAREEFLFAWESAFVFGNQGKHRRRSRRS